MVDSRFFTAAGPIDAASIRKLTGAVITGEEARSFTNVAPLDQATASDISFLDNVKYADMFAASHAGGCFVRPKYAGRAPQGMVLFVTEEPYYAYALTAQALFPDARPQAALSPQAVVASDALMGHNVRIDAGAVIGSRAHIADDCWIGANTVIGDGVVIGAGSRIGALCTISHAIIGKNAILHRGIHIGQDGFGFAPSRQGIVKVPQLGRVLIGEHVEIGSGTCIDRGSGPDTVIGSFSKIDNLVQIGHNVQLGKYVIIAAACGIAGSTHIGDGVMLGGQVGVSGHVRIGAGAKVAAQSGVMHDLPPDASYGGAPAIPVRDWHRQTVAVAALGKRKLC